MDYRDLYFFLMNRLLSKRLLFGFFLSCCCVVTGYAAPKPALPYSNIFQTQSRDFLKQQVSTTETDIKKLAEDCAKGADGTLGAAIRDALAIHKKLASSLPDTEKLFDIDSNCFSGLNKIFDLSFAIPSLATIINAAKDAVLKYAKKKVCTVINDLASMVTEPINQAVSEINNILGKGNITKDSEGIIRGLIADGLSSIDPANDFITRPQKKGGEYFIQDGFTSPQVLFCEQGQPDCPGPTNPDVGDKKPQKGDERIGEEPRDKPGADDLATRIEQKRRELAEAEKDYLTKEAEHKGVTELRFGCLRNGVSYLMCIDIDQKEYETFTAMNEAKARRDQLKAELRDLENNPSSAGMESFGPTPNAMSYSQKIRSASKPESWWSRASNIFRR